MVFLQEWCVEAGCGRDGYKQICKGACGCLNHVLFANKRRKSKRTTYEALYPIRTVAIQGNNGKRCQRSLFLLFGRYG